MKYVPWILGLVWLGIRVTLYYTMKDTNPDGARSAGVMINLLFLIFIIFSVLSRLYKERRSGATSTFFNDFKVVLKENLKYCLAAGVALVIFYNFISTELLDRRARDHQATVEALDTDEELNQIRNENIQLKNLTREEIIKAANDRTEIFTNPKIVSSASFLVLVFVSLIYTLFAVLLFRYFLKMR
jgi:Ca2+/H+ antiporter